LRRRRFPINGSMRPQPLDSKSMSIKSESKRKPRRASPGKKLKHETAGRKRQRADVIVVGGGPAGSVLAWDLSRRGVKVLLIDRAQFPREKVCGDYIEPRGLRLLDQMGCLKNLEGDSPLPITHSATYVNSERCYQGKIPFYGLHNDLPPHGYIIPRERLDHLLLETAARAGARVIENTYAHGFSVEPDGVLVDTEKNGRRDRYRGDLVIGADGVNSVVARSAGLLVEDPRHIALSQRAYAEGFNGKVGEAAFFFDKDFFPGYGWMFPMAGGRVNLGVGILSETCQRQSIKIPALFNAFLKKLKRSHPRCSKLRLCRPPIGGIVKTYGGAGPNYFTRGLLIGDAGSFVDPMTGEGITPAMESALIAVPIILNALSTRSFDSEDLSAYEGAFRRYFDPSMVFLDLCAATLRNTHFKDSWLHAVARGCEKSQKDPHYARTLGACFGGLEINPPGILSQIWMGMALELMTLGPRSAAAFFEGHPSPMVQGMRDMIGWQSDWWKSLLADPLWHFQWSLDLERKWMHAMAVMKDAVTDPRAQGLA
jgi:geranylgeranyl reductase family protein